ncbi:hypothetical protein TWF481_011972 [Arthrobotrys musiformis]|uniref:SET domain-containing protein n=1 Tax=Arthrobotrys musiformis TaxID=47236 RepID=A0AAV9VXG4_9PEZI
MPLPQPQIPQITSIIPGDESTYPKTSTIDTNITISPIPSMGLGVIATRDLPAGTTWYIAKEDAYLPIPQKTFSAIRLAEKKSKEWKLLREFIEMVSVYSSRWNTMNVSLDNIRFLNHTIVEGEGKDGVGNVIIGGTGVAEDTLVGWSAWTNKDVKAGEQLFVNYHGFTICPWANSCEKFLGGEETGRLDFEVVDRETVFEEPVEILLTRAQFEVYVHSVLEREIDKALLTVLAKWGVWDEGRGVWAVRVPVD